jgi:hypothetical protein
VTPWGVIRFFHADWSRLPLDVEALGEEVVSLAIVTDPFGEYDEKLLRGCFKDVTQVFKKHFIVELGSPLAKFVSSHNRRYAHKALETIDVEKCEDPFEFANDWVRLYENLVARYEIKGIPAFSSTSLTRQLHVPGIVAFRAIHEDETVGMLLWYKQNEVGYYHLGAYSDRGYSLRASFALFWSAIDYFSSTDLKWLSLGGGVGVRSDGTDGLSRFKRGWATGSRPVYFCGRIFDNDAYSKIVKARGCAKTDYFPAYRAGEYG